jgi:hypothetical protein
MVKARTTWQPSRTQIVLYGERTEEGAKRNSDELLGIKMKLFKKVSMHAELKCLRMILALLEATTDTVAHTLENYLQEGIMLQNMQNVYLKALQSMGKRSDFFRTVAVAYMTINMTLSSVQNDAVTTVSTVPPGVRASKRLGEWLMKESKDVRESSSLLASVEIIGEGECTIVRVRVRVGVRVRC